MFRYLILPLTYVMAMCTTSAVAQPPAEDFARDAAYTRVELSPGGQFLSLVVPGRKQTAIAIIDIDAGETVSVNGFGIDTTIDEYWWVGPERLVAKPARQIGTFDTPRATGDLIGFDFDGGRVDYLFGQSAEQQVGSKLRKPSREPRAAHVVASLVDDPRWAIVGLDDLGGRTAPDRGTELARINTSTGSIKSLGLAPGDTRSRYVGTRDGEVLMVSAPNSDFSGFDVHWRADEKADWRSLSGLDVSEVLRLSHDGAEAYLLATGAGKRDCLFAVRMDDGSARSLVCHSVADIERVVFAQDSGKPIAAVAEPGLPEWVWVDRKHPDARILGGLINSFPDNVAVWPSARSEDDSRWVLYIYSSSDPGAYYLFDAKQKKVSELVATRPWIQPASMGVAQSFSFKASDGLEVHGYITVPPGMSLDKLPAVVHPHGGPYAVRDSWRWSRDVQFLASRGYAVIQINYRGSSGYGRGYIDAGRGQYGDRMIDDITEAVRHQIELGHVDGSRLCIFGASYGGYAAMRSATREPDLYRCVITYVGISDLRLHRNTTDYTRRERGLRYFVSSIGDDDDELQRLSPIHHLDKLKAPVFIAHGDQDRRVSVEHAKRLRSALEDRDHPHEYLVELGEGHGFRDADNLSKLYSRIDAFIGEHIGD